MPRRDEEKKKGDTRGRAVQRFAFVPLWICYQDVSWWASRAPPVTREQIYCQYLLVPVCDPSKSHTFMCIQHLARDPLAMSFSRLARRQSARFDFINQSNVSISKTFCISQKDISMYYGKCHRRNAWYLSRVRILNISTYSEVDISCRVSQASGSPSLRRNNAWALKKLRATSKPVLVP